MKNSKIIVRVFTGLLVWFLIFKLYGAFISPIYADSIPVFLNMVIDSMIIPYTIGLLGFYLIVKDMEKGECNHESMTAPDMVKAFVLQSGFSIPIMMILNGIMIALGFGKSGIEVSEISNNLLFYIILLLIFNPVFEELLFRKLVLDRLLVLGKNNAIIICAVFFALPHLYSVGLPNMVSTFILGLVWSVVTVKTGKLWPAMVLHSLSNLYGAFFPMIMTRTIPTSAAYMLIVILIVPAIAIGILVSMKTNKRMKLENS